ncbi:MAG: nitroreductase [Alphaproteobacteria bacterium]|jgi:nitroreductase|nr:nitroreductase [Alphaproteobacteria bacterium]MDP6563957.1 nitroreductase [Alphaproteobacteria bacterium]
MNVHDAIMSRRSVRRFLAKPVPMDSLRRILEGAGMAPSGHNIQPWQVYVVAGAEKERLSADILKAIENDRPEDHQPEFDYYPTNWFEPFQSRRRATGFGLYDALGIAREDKAARQAQMNRNYTFFDAPVGIFVGFHRDLATGTYMDIGMFIENILIGARGEGLHTCGQAAFTWFHDVVRKHLPIPEEEILACGISLGYEDTEAPENAFRTEKLPIDEFTTFLGFD